MKSKKFISSLFIVAVIVSLFSIGVFTLETDNAATLSITPNVTEASRGEEVNFTFKLSKVTNLGGLEFTVNIPEGLTYKSYALDVDTITLGQNSAISFTENAKKFVLSSAYNGYTSSSETTLMTITCSVDNNASGNLALTTSGLDCGDLDGEYIFTTVESVGVMVCAHENKTKVPAKSATCTTAGNKAYWVCTKCHKYFEDNDGEVGDQVEENSWVINAIGHEWGEVSYVWSADNRTCTATRVCNHNGDHKQTKEGTVTSEVTIPVTCTQAGEIKYTATFGEGQFATETQTKVEVIPIDANAHEWGEEVSYVWSADNRTCTATRVCNHNGDHKQTKEGTVTSEVTTPATCTEAGVRTYTATFGEGPFATETQTKVEVIPIDANAHKWGEVSYTWSANKSTCTATRICMRDESHVETETVNSTNAVTTAATCTEAGVRTYTATFKNEAFGQRTTTGVIEALGHNYDESTWYSDEESHWHKCARCDDKKDEAVHSFGYWELYPEDNSKHKRVCSVCGAIETAAHSFGDWEADPEDNTKHKRVCSECNAADFSQTDISSEIHIQFFEGVISEGASLKVQKIDELSQEDLNKATKIEMDDVILYDISIIDESGNYLQPNGIVTVHIPIPDNVNKNRLHIYRISDDKQNSTEINFKIVNINGKFYCEFEVDHFSLYALVEASDENIAEAEVSGFDLVDSGDKTKDIKSDENDGDGFIKKTGQDLREVYFVVVTLILGCIVIRFLLRKIREGEHTKFKVKSKDKNG